MKTLLLLTFFVFTSSISAQEMDSLQILKSRDWYTLQWLEKDTVILLPRAKKDTIYKGLTSKQELRKKYRNKIGERISFESGKLKYSDHAICKVGEQLHRINSFVFEKNKVVIEFQSVPWNRKEWIYKKREFEILKWSQDGIVLR